MQNIGKRSSRYEKSAANIGKQDESLPFWRIKQNVNALPHGFSSMGAVQFCLYKKQKTQLLSNLVLADEKSIIQTVQTKKKRSRRFIREPFVITKR